MLTNCYPLAVKTIEAIRLENYRTVVADLARERGHEINGPEIAAALGLSAVYVWQLSNGKRSSIESKAARKIEQTLGKPEGWLDTDFSLWPFPGIDAARFERLSQQQKTEIQGVVRRMIMDFEAEGASGSGESFDSQSDAGRKSA